MHSAPCTNTSVSTPACSVMSLISSREHSRLSTTREKPMSVSYTHLFSLMHAGASFLIVLRQLAVGTVLTCLFCFIVYLPLRRLSGKSRKRSR